MIEYIFLILIIFLAMSFLTSILISIWVYKDAKKRDFNVFLWILIVWLIPLLLGFLLYMKNRD